MDPNTFFQTFANMKAQIARVLVGQEALVEGVVVALLDAASSLVPGNRGAQP